MKTFCVVACYSLNWQPVVNAIPCICWGIMALVVLYFLVRYVVVPLIANNHELMVRKRNHDYEIEMSGLKSLKEVKDKLNNGELDKELLKSLEEIEKCQGQFTTEKEKNEKLMKENEQLKKEKAELEKKALKDTNDAYHKIINNIGKCIH